LQLPPGLIVEAQFDIALGGEDAAVCLGHGFPFASRDMRS
jgi:hypothetical protein